MKPTTRPPENRPPSPDRGRLATNPTPGSGLGAFLDRSGELHARAAEVGGRITEEMTQRVVKEIADQVMADQPAPGWVVRGWRWAFGLGRPSTPKIRPPKPTPRPRSGELAPTPTWMQWLGVWLDRTVGSLPLLAPLGLSGWYTSHAGHEMLALPWAVAVLLSVALEGGVWRLARLLEKTLVAGDTTVSLRLGIAGYLTLIGGLIFAYEVTSQTGWSALLTADGWAHIDWTKTWPAIVASCLSVAGVYIWSKVARWQRREELHEQGRIDAQLIRFSVWRWLFCPIETPRAVRYAVKHSIEKPEQALDEYRADRDLRHAARVHERAVKRAERADKKAAEKATKAAGKKKPTPDRKQPTPADPTPDHPTPVGTDPTPVGSTPTTDPTTVGPARSAARQRKSKPTPRPALRSVEDEEVLSDLRAQYPNTVPSKKQVIAVVMQRRSTCSSDKAIRLRNLYAAELAEKSA